jgi:hypothetical protein
MGDFGRLLAQGGGGLPELIRSFADYSYVLKAHDIPSLREGENLVAELELLPGSWIVVAKATVRAPGGAGSVEVQLGLTATEDQVVAEDRSDASATNSHYSMVALILGTRFDKGGRVRLAATPVGSATNGELVNCVIAAIKMDKLLVWDF